MTCSAMPQARSASSRSIDSPFALEQMFALCIHHDGTERQLDRGDDPAFTPASLNITRLDDTHLSLIIARMLV